MFPFIPDGSILFFEPADSVRPGDIVLSRDRDRWLAHRVVRLDAGTVTTWGDWNRFPDPPVPFECILGRCVQIRRKGVDIHLDLPCVRATGRLAALVLPILKSLRRKPCCP